MDYKLFYSKPNPIDLEELKKQNPHEDFNPFEIQDLQLYNPIYSRFFEMNEGNSQKIALNHPFHIKDLEHVINADGTETREKKVFIKFSPLLDPYRYMIGKYNVEDNSIRTMPKIDSTSEQCHSKILSIHNTSYVDCFFTFLSSILKNNYGFENGIDFFGSYLGLQEKFKVGVSDDLEFLQNSEFFNKHLGSLFHMEDNDLVQQSYSSFPGSRKNKMKLNLLQEEDNTDLLGIQELEILDSPFSLESEEVETVYSQSPKKNNGSLNSSSSSSSNNSEVNYSSEDDSQEECCEDSDDEDSDEESEEDSDEESEEEEEEEIYGYINRFPIQMICMEQCDGTLDKLLENDEIDEENGCSALFQVIMILLTYQRIFHFTHNDLHTNNIMYVNTDKPFLYYQFNNVVYKVPTYGKIYKLIDFGRGIYKYMGKIFCSDSFGPGGDASTQYNCEPFFNDNKARLEPNFSFDLCRLGTSMFDFMMEIDDDIEEYDELQKVVREWCLDDKGKNILYLKNGDERYPSFKLYKMIARTVHKHTPEAQLERPFFSKYKFEGELKEDATIFSLDKLTM
tara:strand:+ start:1265 stop:2959 length:1695 start_codon:yes stop_codon:yes gene_type:complete